MIRGGAEYSLGIYITGVDRGSAADCGGLKVQFMPVLPTSFYLIYTEQNYKRNTFVFAPIFHELNSKI